MRRGEDEIEIAIMAARILHIGEESIAGNIAVLARQLDRCAAAANPQIRRAAIGQGDRSVLVGDGASDFQRNMAGVELGRDSFGQAEGLVFNPAPAV